MTSLSKNNTTLADAIIDAAEISPERKSRYKTQWRRWDQWCSEHHVDPYHATRDDMSAYLVDRPDMSKTNRKRLSAAVNLVYKMAPGSGPFHIIGKPKHKPTSEIDDGALRAYQVGTSNFTNWCHARGKIAIPADQHDIAEYMRQCSTDYSPVTAIGIFTHISRLHFDAGYHDISKLSAVAEVLSDIRARIQEGEKQTPPRAKNPSTTTQRERYRNNWRHWAKENNVHIDAPTTANVCDFIREESKYLIVKRIRPKLLAISEMYGHNPYLTKAPEVAELLDALILQDAEEQRQGTKKQKRNANPLLSASLPTNPELVEQLRSEGLTEKEILRLTSCQAHTLSDKTRKSYQRYWARYKIWCQERDKQPEDAGPGLLVTLSHRTIPTQQLRPLPSQQATRGEKSSVSDPLLLPADPFPRQPRIKPASLFNHDGHNKRQPHGAILDDRAPDTNTTKKSRKQLTNRGHRKDPARLRYGQH